jgi:hypothetical protein
LSVKNGFNTISLGFLFVLFQGNNTAIGSLWGLHFAFNPAILACFYNKVFGFI